MEEFEEEQKSRKEKLEDVEGKIFELRCRHCAKLLAWNNPERLSFEVRCVRCLNISPFYYDTDQLLYLTDNTGKILYANEQVERITGYTVEEVLGKTPAVWGKQMPGDFYKQLWTNLLHNKQPIVVRMVNRRKNGQLYKALTRITPIMGGNGKVAFFLGAQTPIEAP